MIFHSRARVLSLPPSIEGEMRWALGTSLIDLTKVDLTVLQGGVYVRRVIMKRAMPQRAFLKYDTRPP